MNNGQETEKDSSLIEKLQSTCEKLLSTKKIVPLEQLEQGYSRFFEKFNPSKLKNLDGEALLNTIFSHGVKDSLVYWLEFKNDEEFRTTEYGSIAGGSAFKFVMYKRTEDGKWITGNPQKPTILTIDEAIKLARELRQSLVDGAALIEKLPMNATIESYIELQKSLESALVSNMSNLGWVHKYYHLLYPAKIDDFHNCNWQRAGLINILERPLQDDKLYVMAGQYMNLANQAGLPINHVTAAIHNLFGGPKEYYRIGTTGNNKSYWSEMRDNGYVSIGWPAVGNLREYDTTERSKMKEAIVPKLNANYPNTPQAIGKAANQILSFYFNIKAGDIVVAVDGEKVLGVGKITEGYSFIENLDFPHVLKTDWRYIADTHLPNAQEGLLNTVYRYKNLDNIMAIEKMAKEERTAISPVVPIAPAVVTVPLSETTLQIESVLIRKKQVILYGPPGTGKTYQAERACTDLAARALFNKSFDSLSPEEKTEVSGSGNANGVVRMCCFHPSYGYEDFIEGLKPVLINDQIQFKPKDGIFKTLCADAKKESNKKFYLIIDEINRGDISRIFGELIMLIEAGKRNKQVLLPLSNVPFEVPDNVFIVGTMNTADRSIALLDVALRRRFGFIELMPDYNLLAGVAFGELPLDKWLNELNARICENIGKDARNLQIGHSYFLEKEKPVTDIEKFKRIVKEDVIPLIEEYCYGDYQLISKILGDMLVNVTNKLIRFELFNSPDSADLISALLKPCPQIRNLVVTPEPNDAENGVEPEPTVGNET